MKILIVNDHARITGGADIYCFELDRLLCERGHEIRFLSTMHPENLTDQGAFIPQIVSRSSRDSLGPAAAARVAGLACWNQTAAVATKHLIDDFAPDVVHAHKLYPQLSVAPIVVAAQRSVPIVQTAHDYEFVSASAFDDGGGAYDRSEERLPYQLLNSLLFRIKRAVHVPRVDSWITVSRDLADVYRGKGGIDSHALPNFVPADPEPARPFSERAGALSVGRLAVEKGLDEVIELARRSPRLPVTIAGLGPLAEQAATAAATIPNLTFLGALTPAEVAVQMRAAKVLVMASAWREPAGLVALEAMRAGTPIVAYDRGGLAEYIRDADAGALIPPTIEALITTTSALCDDPDRWQRHSRSALAAAGTTHSPDKHLDEIEATFRRVTSDPRASV